MGPGSFIVIGACILAAFFATLPALPQSDDLVPFDVGYLEAAALIDVSLQAVRQDAATESDLQAPSLFGMETEPVAGGVAAKWRAVKADIDRERQVLARCRAQEACPVVAQNLLNIVAESTGRSGVARVGLINRAVDLAITATSDEAQWGVVDHWSPPFETLQTHRGDCEDYAIVKYVALLLAGLSHDDVKIVILQNLLPKEDHAVVAARVDGHWLILDNRRLALVHDTEMVGSIPEFVLDEDGTQRFVPSNRAGQRPRASPSRSASPIKPAPRTRTMSAFAAAAPLMAIFRGAEFKALVANSLLAAEAPKETRNAPGLFFVTSRVSDQRGPRHPSISETAGIAWAMTAKGERYKEPAPLAG
jgi:predicted transglutaminase-like cysteine proteinase